MSHLHKVGVEGILQFYIHGQALSNSIGVEIPSQIWKFSEMNIPIPILKKLKLKVIFFDLYE